MKTVKQLIQELNWFDFLRKIKEILFRTSDNPLNSKIQAGDNITLSGEGTEESPLTINSTGGGSSEVPTLQDVVHSGNVITSGIVSQGAPIEVRGGGMDVYDGISFINQAGDTVSSRLSASNSSGITTLSLQNGLPLDIIGGVRLSSVTNQQYNRGLALNSDNEIVSYANSEISGTFTTPVSITVVNGIITAIT